MNYKIRKHDIFCDIDKTIINNFFYFDIYNIDQNFYNLYLTTQSILGIKYDENFLDISIMFEFLLKNHEIFCKLIKGESKKESLDILCFLNINIYIIKKLNIIINKYDKCNKLLNEIIKLNKIYI